MLHRAQQTHLDQKEAYQYLHLVLVPVLEAFGKVFFSSKEVVRALQKRKAVKE